MSAETAKLSRGMWMWEGERARRAIEDAAARGVFFDFCEAPHGERSARVDLVYLETRDSYREGELRAFLAVAHERGLKVEFLYADRDWQGDHLAVAKEACFRCLEAFNPPGAEGERFDGIHLHLMDAGKWSQEAFRGLLIGLRQRIEACHRAQPDRVTLAADFEFQWAESGGNDRPQFPDAIRYCDYVVSMACRDTAGAQASCAVPQALAAARQGKGFFIAAETRWLVNQDFVTYYEEGWEYMERELAKLPALIADHGGRLTGVAIHHYDSYVRMKQEPRISPFPDAQLDYWAAPYILAAYQAQIIGGYPDGSYQPALPVTHDQMAVFITRALLGSENIPESPTEPSFLDVPPDYWAYRWIECAKAHDIMVGSEDGQFHPQEVVSRGQMAVFVARSIATPTGEAGLADYSPPEVPTFSDVTPDNEWSWCYRHIAYLAAREIASGYPDGRYHPEYPCTRDQIAVYIVKAFSLPIDW